MSKYHDYFTIVNTEGGLFNLVTVNIGAYSAVRYTYGFPPLEATQHT